MGNSVLDILIHFSKSLVEAFRFENRIPSKIVVTSSSNNLALYSVDAKNYSKIYWAFSDKQDRFGFRAFLVSENALSISSLIFKTNDQFIQSFMTEFVQEPFTINLSIIFFYIFISTYMVLEVP